MFSGTVNSTIAYYTEAHPRLLANRNPHCKAPKDQLEMNFRCCRFYSMLLIVLLYDAYI